jgi:hypothetical protein
MKSNLRNRIFLLVIGLLLICAAGVIVEAQFNILQRAYDNYVMDNRNHYLSCNELPTKSEVESVVKQHQDVIQQIQQVAPGFVGVEIDSSICNGKADLLIWYGSHQQRIAIEKIIAGNTFFGVPYRLQNR